MRPLTSTFVFLAAMALVGPVLAQSTYGPDRPGGPGGDMPGGRRGGPGGMMHGRRMQALDPVVAVRALGEELTQRQKTFDDTLKSFLAKDQWKRYDKWRSDERKRAEQERRERWGQGPGGPEPS